MLLANARLEAKGADSPFRETKAKNHFLRMLEEREKEIMQEATGRREYIESLSMDGKSKKNGEPLPAGKYLGYNKIDLTNDLNEQMRINAREFSDYCEKSEEVNDIDILLHFIESVETGSNGDIKNQARWKFHDGFSYYYNGMPLRSDDPGNIMFGYIGATKYSLKFLQFGAGIYQIYSGTSDMDYANSYFDDPRDSAMIQLGYELYMQEHKQ